MKKKIILFTIMSAFVLFNLSLLGANLNNSNVTFDQIKAEVTDALVVCDKPQQGYGRCFEFDHEETFECVLNGYTYSYCYE